MSKLECECFSSENMEYILKWGLKHVVKIFIGNAVEVDGKMCEMCVKYL